MASGRNQHTGNEVGKGKGSGKAEEDGSWGGGGERVCVGAYCSSEAGEGNSSKGVSEQQHRSCARLRHQGTCGRLFCSSSHKTFRSKRFLAKKTRQNQPIPHWTWAETGNTTRHNSKTRHWRGTRLGLSEVAQKRRSHPAAPRMPAANHVPEKVGHYCRGNWVFLLGNYRKNDFSLH